MSLAWPEARPGNGVLLVPLREAENIFAKSAAQGYRYLAISSDEAGNFRAILVELLLADKSVGPEVALGLAEQACSNYHAQTSERLGEVTGRVLYYSTEYQYLAGYTYHKGQLIHPARLLLVSRAASPDTAGGTSQRVQCIPVITDWYDPNTWEYITTTDDLSCVDDGAGGGSGGEGGPTYPDPGQPTNPPYGGGAGSGTTGTTSVPMIISGPKVRPEDELKCFDVNQPATLTIYVQQSNPNTDQLMGPSQVGHTFIGIEQNGISRYMGYYPNTGKSQSQIMVGLGMNYPGEIRALLHSRASSTLGACNVPDAAVSQSVKTG
ncbi:hypothetical protein [Hymenobacter sp. CRA2]|uniref:hypothetical protein n=1 Tax=Hymenobacter sp. CRA2 TaxID=1955620 RepID=UPI0015903D97|nr:hypothetical protein [Hymenobacter sp. CRA2]